MDVDDIAERFGLSVAYVPSMRNGPARDLVAREDRGNAILSTEPLVDVRAIELPFGKQRRVAITALIQPRNKPGLVLFGCAKPVEPAYPFGPAGAGLSFHSRGVHALRHQR